MSSALHDDSDSSSVIGLRERKRLLKAEQLQPIDSSDSSSVIGLRKRKRQLPKARPKPTDASDSSSAIGLRKRKRLLEQQPLPSSSSRQRTPEISRGNASGVTGAIAAPVVGQASVDARLPDDRWSSFIECFNTLADAPAAPADAPPTFSSVLSADCAKALQEARDQRALKQQLKALASARVDAKRPKAKRSVVQVASNDDLLPLTGKPISDGLVYDDSLFASQLELINRDPFLDAILPEGMLTRTEAFAEVHQRVRAWRDDQAFDTIWYVGISRGPSQRFHRLDYGYFMRGFDSMIAIYRGPPNWCGELERSLITEWKGKMGNQNSNPGGENVPPAGIGCWVYVVSTSLGDDKDLETRAVARKAHKKDRANIALSANMLSVCGEYAIPDLLEGRR